MFCRKGSRENKSVYLADVSFMYVPHQMSTCGRHCLPCCPLPISSSLGGAASLVTTVRTVNWWNLGDGVRGRTSSYTRSVCRCNNAELIPYCRDFPGGPVVKNPLANTGAQSPSLVQEDVPRDSSACAPQPEINHLKTPYCIFDSCYA